MSPLLTYIQRTLVPMLVGLLVAWLASIGIALPAEVETQIVSVIAVLSGIGYATLAHKLEQRWPALSVLFGTTQNHNGYSNQSAPSGDHTADDVDVTGDDEPVDGDDEETVLA